MAHAQKAQQFSADMNLTSTLGPSGEMKLYVSGDKARIDLFLQPADQPGTIISDPAMNTMYYLKPPPQQIYMQTSMRTPLTWMYLDWQHFDPANPCANLPSISKCEKLGTESIAGNECDKWKVSGTTAHVTTLWIDKKNGIPIKQEIKQ